MTTTVDAPQATLASQDLASQDLASQDPASQDPASQDLASQDLASQDPASQDPASQATAAPQVLPAGVWTVDPVHSQASFAVAYHVGTFRGTFSPIQATLEVGENGQARLTGSVLVSGVRVQDENLAAHLQSPEFFDAERTPEISFASTAVRPARVSAPSGSTAADIEIDGELTIRGVTLPVAARGRVGERKQYMDRPYVGLELEATVDRTRFGLSWNNPLPSGEPALADEVTIAVELFLTRQD